MVGNIKERCTTVRSPIGIDIERQKKTRRRWRSASFGELIKVRAKLIIVKIEDRVATIVLAAGYSSRMGEE